MILPLRGAELNCFIQNCDAISALGVTIAPHQCVEVFSQIDEDGGGSITFAELCEWFGNISFKITITLWFDILMAGT